MARSGDDTAVVTELRLLPAPVRAGSEGSNTALEVSTWAVLMKLPAAGAKPVTVKVTDPPDGSAVMVDDTALPATLTVPHVAPPAARQEAPTPITPAGTLSVNTAPSPACGPALLTTMV